MECTTCGAVHAAGVTECDPTVRAAFEAENAEGATFDAAAVTAAVTAGIRAAFENTDGGPIVVAAGQPVAQVTEAAPYVFDGSANGEHEFSTDVFAMARGDFEAATRVNTFIGEALNPVVGPQFAAVAPGDVAALNPTQNRPEMYVDRLVQATPLWTALRKGGIANNTPFTFPKFLSADELVDDHVMGVEPDPGSFKVTQQTVTPTAVSGKAEIPREIVDAGGNPQVSRLLWREMERSYYKNLEKAVSDLLAASNPAPIVLPAGAEDAALVDALEAEYAALQFVDGGFRFDYAPTHAGLYKRLTAASDSTGRKLLPIIGATNANGGTRSRFAAVDVAGVEHLPVPTLAGTDADGVRKSYLLASEDVHAWASPPRELRFEYRVALVDIALWGYKATAITRLDGVRSLNYNRAPAV